MKKINFFLLFLLIFNSNVYSSTIDIKDVELDNSAESLYKGQNSNRTNTIANLEYKIDKMERDLGILRKVIEAYTIKLNKLIDIVGSKKTDLTDDAILENLTLDTGAQNDEDSYKVAYQVMLSKEHSPQLKKEYFSNFIINYPKSNYLSNAYYWLGELYLRDKDYELANKHFDVLINKYSSSTKVPSAMLKRAYGLIGLNQISKAKKQLVDITNNYPNTTAAAIANKKLTNLPNN